MPQSSELLSQFAKALESGGTEDLEKATQAIKDLPFETEDHIRAKYRLAVHLYLVQKKLVEGMEIFRDIAKAHIPCEETRLSQINLAMGLWITGHQNQALFELRKVISEEKDASQAKAMALNFLGLFLQELKGRERELETVQNESIDTIEQLIENETNIEDAAHFKLLWATALEDRGRPEDLTKALAVAKEIVDSKAPLPKTTTSLAREALKRLSAPRRK